MRTLVLGLGNPLLGDDALGLEVAAHVRAALPPGVAVEVDEEYHGGLRLMERLAGYERAILVDAICTGTHAPGTLLLLGPHDLPTQHSGSSHDVNLPTALALAAALELPMPVLQIVAVEAAQVWDFDGGCSPAVDEAVPRAAAAVLELLGAAPPRRGQRVKEAP